MIYLLLLGLLCGWIGALILRNKGRGAGVGFLIGFLLGPIGVIVTLVMGRDDAAMESAALASGANRKCPACAELVKAEALKCRFCGHELEPLAEGGEAVLAADDNLRTNTTRLLLVLGGVILLGLLGKLIS